MFFCRTESKAETLLVIGHKWNMRQMSLTMFTPFVVNLGCSLVLTHLTLKWKLMPSGLTFGIKIKIIGQDSKLLKRGWDVMLYTLGNLVLQYDEAITGLVAKSLCC